MTSLQLGLIAAGALLVAGVLVYNWMQERRVRRRIREAFSRDSAAAGPAADPASSGAVASRIEPSFAQSRPADPVPENALRGASGEPEDDGYEPPLEVHARIASEVAAGDVALPSPLGQSRRRTCRGDRARAPSPTRISNAS